MQVFPLSLSVSHFICFWNKSIKMLCHIQCGGSEIHRFAFMFGLSGEITARGICVEGRGGVGGLTTISVKVQTKVYYSHACSMSVLLAFGGACVLCMQFKCIH